MSNDYGIPIEVENGLRTRDVFCVYCHVKMQTFEAGAGGRSDMATVEHFNFNGPFDWADGLDEADLAICCWRCNSSKGNKPLMEWFKTAYCKERNINAETVAEPVRKYIEREGLCR